MPVVVIERVTRSTRKIQCPHEECGHLGPGDRPVRTEAISGAAASYTHDLEAQDLTSEQVVGRHITEPGGSDNVEGRGPQTECQADVNGTKEIRGGSARSNAGDGNYPCTTRIVSLGNPHIRDPRESEGIGQGCLTKSSTP